MLILCDTFLSQSLFLMAFPQFHTKPLFELITGLLDPREHMPVRYA